MAVKAHHVPGRRQQTVRLCDTAMVSRTWRCITQALGTFPLACAAGNIRVVRLQRLAVSSRERAVRIKYAAQRA